MTARMKTTLPLVNVFAFALTMGAAITLLMPVYAKVTASDPPPSLLVYQKSEDVRFSQDGKVWQVNYVARVDYPADDILRFIRNALEHQGWQPLKENILNPGLLSSHETGWVEYLDRRTSPETKVRQWLAQWKNPQGNVVWYTLQYRYKQGAVQIPKTVSVIGSYYPASIVEQQLKAVEADRKRPKGQRIGE